MILSISFTAAPVMRRPNERSASSSLDNKRLQRLSLMPCRNTKVLRSFTITFFCLCSAILIWFLFTDRNHSGGDPRQRLLHRAEKRDGADWGDGWGALQGTQREAVLPPGGGVHVKVSFCTDREEWKSREHKSAPPAVSTLISTTQDQSSRRQVSVKSQFLWLSHHTAT